MRIVFWMSMLALLAACRTNRMPVIQTHEPRAQVEHRGVWIATVKNIDWPKDMSQTVPQLREHYREIIDFYADMGYNAAYVQLRTAGDALYPTDLAPWSRFITGEEGRPLDKDLLPWMIDYTHERGMEFHAWLNPYRATTDRDTSVLADDHLFYKKREWIVGYGTKYYFNPALPEVQNHMLDVIKEMVSQYDVDGIHFDDYFYPYKVAGETFDDSLQYVQRSDQSLSLDDWRRENVNQFVAKTHEVVHDIKPYVQFGVSPFGVWRNRRDDPSGSDTRAGQTTYDDLYADTRTWIREGWMDYIAPQAYWSMYYPPAGHKALVDWWVEESPETPLYMGLGIYKVESNADSAWYDLQEIPTQIKYGRLSGVVDGFITFSAKSLMNKPKLVKLLKADALAPKAMTNTQRDWGHSIPSYSIISDTIDRRRNINIKMNDRQAKTARVTYLRPRALFRKAKWITEDIPIIDGQFSLDLHKKVEQISLIFLSSTGYTSRATTL